MSPSYIPSVRARRLARSLREFREQAELGVTAAAARLGWSQGKVSHIESARNKPNERDVQLMLNLYGVGSPDREAILSLAREAEERGWWTDYIDVLNGPYVALEDAASEIGVWDPQVIPGLLQTPDYAREIIKAGDLGKADDIERRIRARMVRQTILTREIDPPRLRAVLDESVLGRPIGGPAVWRDQLRRLHSDAQRPNVTIQFLPQSVGTHCGLEGSLIVLGFAEPADPDVAYAEGFFGVVYMESPQQVEHCRLAFGKICESALSPESSLELIEAATKRRGFDHPC
ncbi:helix-turn-helix transcriptional regulator [Actinomadura sp. WMMB 499]|uniref:helix-turn-helix domain-containing protein n=1 Tax=Actinomadura sp. WMMB 499 TaxID=1219491 RepID=UPI0012489C18|nr:helix-turn-helix transcriptional regulator [Actinomadura sp. WMMB 499]QFG23223.1 helix-turn-helix domain-containing protein [Actinomadura sp. WMMB 499]